MSANFKNPFKNLTLEQEEIDINKAVESGKTRIVQSVTKLKKRYQQYAKFTLEKTKNINIRLSEKDLYKLKAKAAKEGIPYQTLASSLLHQSTA